MTERIVENRERIVLTQSAAGMARRHRCEESLYSCGIERVQTENAGLYV